MPQRNDRTNNNKHKNLQPNIFVANGFSRFLRNDPFPVTLTRDTTYASYAGLSCSVATVIGTTAKFGLNCLYDPDIAGTGHQPYGFDQLCSSAGPYERYKVLGVSVKLTLMNDTSTNNGTFVVMALNRAGSAATMAGKTLEQMAEKHYTRVIHLPNTGEQEKEFLFDFPNLFELFGFTKRQFDADDSNTTGSYSGNPALYPQLEIGVVNNVSTMAITVLTQLTYSARFYQRVALAQS